MKKHKPNKAAALPGNGLFSFFSIPHSTLVEEQDLTMSLFAFFGCLCACELVAIQLSDVELVTEGIMVNIIRTKTTNKQCRFLLPFSLPNRVLSPAHIASGYLDKVKPWLAERKLTRLWPRPINSSFSAQFRGVNYASVIAKKIAMFLKLDQSKTRDTHFDGPLQHAWQTAEFR
jgi:hypothetical protein